MEEVLRAGIRDGDHKIRKVRRANEKKSVRFDTSAASRQLLHIKNPKRHCCA